MWNINNKDTKTTSVMSFWCIYCELWIYFAPFPVFSWLTLNKLVLARWFLPEIFVNYLEHLPVAYVHSLKPFNKLPLFQKFYLGKAALLFYTTQRTNKCLITFLADCLFWIHRVLYMLSLHDLVSFVQFKKRVKLPWRSATFNRITG